MRKLTGAMSIAIGSTLLAATATLAATPHQHSTGASEAARRHARDTVQSEWQPTPYAYPAPAQGSPHDSVWSGYHGEAAPPHHCQCGHCGQPRKGSLRKWFNKLSSGIDRTIFGSADRCQCGGCDAGNDFSCAADCDSACDAMGPQVMYPGEIHPGMIPTPRPLPRMQPVPRTQGVPSTDSLPGETIPVPEHDPAVDQYQSAPLDPFQDDPVSSARQPAIEAPGYYQR